MGVARCWDSGLEATSGLRTGTSSPLSVVLTFLGTMGTDSLIAAVVLSQLGWDKPDFALVVDVLLAP